jgi:hypothetical protein
MGIENIRILSEVEDWPIVTSKPLTAAELSDLRTEHERGLHDTNKCVCCPECFPPPK